ncbi:hypothetical protein ACI01nite_12580 [Acetobacter cibinongensis]|uniref:Glycosyl/hexosyl transferase n=1 Tax=Acetobacter cibinongensis TaxID=146475 RepID=A0A0D6N5S2_9PROT|nr:glycosyltransferase family 4 protein [Acetobacter cibinongensis]GAN60846.1 glycosyl/hexosyl transferase [Acetobacter cibinongensis]GBQ13450.1 hexosyltransferase [Acetobacter cibinongensis NRIC 0482]GEL58656.1 hypothetical protein ACI01nite_12580 [Acetobacter cibinongensis]
MGSSHEGGATVAASDSATCEPTRLNIATVLPPSEAFAEGEAGAIALLVQRMADGMETVLGQAPQGQPFSGVRFVPVKPLLRPYSLSKRYALAVAQRLKYIKPDLIEVHNRPDVALALHGLLPNVPVMLVLHNDPCSMRAARSAAEREKLGCAVAVVAVSEWVRGRFVSQGVKACVRVLPNSLDLSVLPPRPAIREKTILFAGRIVADKGADAFVAACASVLPQNVGWRAEMIGADRFGPASPETPFLAALRPKAQAAGIIMRGYQPHASVLQAMARAAIVVVPSRWAEPFGMVALEAMACGAAVLVSAHGGLPDIVADAGSYCDPDTLENFVAALDRLVQDGSLRQQLGQQGMHRALAFDTATIRSKRLALHEDIVREWQWRGTFQKQCR